MAVPSEYGLLGQAVRVTAVAGPCPDRPGRDQLGHLWRARPVPAGLRSRPSTAEWPLSSALGPLYVTPAVPRQVRRFAVTVLDEWRLTPVTEAAELIVSELVTNVLRAAARHAGQGCDAEGRPPALSLRLMSDLSWLQVEVWDNLPVSAGAPEVRRVGPDEECGRGLQLVEALSQDWGWDQATAGDAKRVWALLAIA